jgi:ribosome-binding protein aMBF1 (putative translation factor)
MHKGEETMETRSEHDRRKEFGRAIRYRIEKQGHTPVGFAKKIGYRPDSVQEILYGQAGMTRAEMVKFAKALDLRPSEGRRQGDPFIDLPDDDLYALFLDGVPKDEPRLSDLYKY